ncbi:ferredoxin [Streptomyces sp. NPDC001034]|uniref:ferredoxin n=1 Tax=Streptomyces sp. NPDC001034 TaxID=3154375 RepID=UPI00332DF000
MTGSHAANAARTTVNPFGPSVALPADTRPAEAVDVPAVRVSVDNNHCELYAICQQEAPEVFDLAADGRLRYDATPDAAHTPAVRQAARCCPMQAITLTQENQR